jgi:hypothetical protein
MNSQKQMSLVIGLSGFIAVRHTGENVGMAWRWRTPAAEDLVLEFPASRFDQLWMRPQIEAIPLNRLFPC